MRHMVWRFTGSISSGGWSADVIASFITSHYDADLELIAHLLCPRLYRFRHSVAIPSPQQLRLFDRYRL